MLVIPLFPDLRIGGKPVVTVSIITLCVLMHLASDEAFLERFMYYPDSLDPLMKGASISSLTLPARSQATFLAAGGSLVASSLSRTISMMRSTTCAPCALASSVGRDPTCIGEA